MNHKKNVLTIAGSDSSGGAGIQADIKTFEALNVYSASVITSITAQNTRSVQSVFDLPSHLISKQLDAVCSDTDFSAIKIGMLKCIEYIELVSQKLSEYTLTNIVLDPVMVSTSGHILLDEQAKATLCSTLFPLTTLITPNIPEAASLLNTSSEWVEQNTQEAAQKLFEAFDLNAVLLKGGHMESPRCIDTLAFKPTHKDSLQIHTFTYPKIDTLNTHGTGCTLSSAITAHLAQGLSLSASIEKAGVFVHKALKYAYLQHVGAGHGPLNHRSASPRTD